MFQFLMLIETTNQSAQIEKLILITWWFCFSF